jgi:hypothetical protein
MLIAERMWQSGLYSLELHRHEVETASLAQSLAGGDGGAAKQLGGINAARVISWTSGHEGRGWYD